MNPKFPKPLIGIFTNLMSVMRVRYGVRRMEVSNEGFVFHCFAVAEKNF